MSNAPIRYIAFDSEECFLFSRYCYRDYDDVIQHSKQELEQKLQETMRTEDFEAMHQTHVNVLERINRVERAIMRHRLREGAEKQSDEALKSKKKH